MFLLLVNVLDDVDANRLLDVEIDVSVVLLGVAENRRVHEVGVAVEVEVDVEDVEGTLVQAPLVLVEVEAINTNLVLEVLKEIAVEVVEVHVSTVDEVEVLVLGTVLTEHLILPLLADVLGNVNDVAMNREVDVEVDGEVEQLGVAEIRVVGVEMLLVTLALL
eukprot:1780504-Amphidinium_carterae.1